MAVGATEVCCDHGSAGQVRTDSMLNLSRKHASAYHEPSETGSKLHRFQTVDGDRIAQRLSDGCELGHHSNKNYHRPAAPGVLLAVPEIVVGTGLAVNLA